MTSPALGAPPAFCQTLQAPDVREGRHELLERAILLVALSTVGAKWLTLGSVAGFDVELSNFGTLIVIALAAVLVLSRGWLIISRTHNLLLVTMSFLFFSLVFHSDGPGLAIMSMISILGAYAVVNCERFHYGVFHVAFLMFIFIIAISIFASGSDFFSGVMSFFQDGNQGKFFFKVVRPIYNAFSPDFSDEKTTTLNNIVAGTSSIFFVLFLSLILSGQLLYSVYAVFCIAINFVLFSSTANSAMAFAIIIAVLLLVSKSTYLMIILLTTMIMLTSFILFEGASLSFLNSYLENESSNAAARLDQYNAALTVIDKAPLLGSGLMEVNGFVIHNFVLFSFASSGIFGGLLSIVACLIAIYVCVSCTVKLIDGRPYRPEYFLGACLPVLFLARIMLGGGGGVPTDVGALALALSIIAMRDAEAPIRRAQVA